VNRRQWLAGMGGALFVPATMRGARRYALPSVVARRRQQQQQPAAPRDTAAAPNSLDYPSLVGRTRAPVDRFDNDPLVISIERKLRCTCGCTLDVYTCRTTDFTCTYSPAMHKDVVALLQEGATPDQVVQAFVDQYGESVLMAPPASGFNLAGYLVPGLVVTAAGLALAAWLTRRRSALVVAAPHSGGPPGAAGSAEPKPEDLERLQRALDDVES
jgi:cytochrome c-type biogenesis protein CcmH/NrfF